MRHKKDGKLVKVLLFLMEQILVIFSRIHTCTCTRVESILQQTGHTAR